MEDLRDELEALQFEEEWPEDDEEDEGDQEYAAHERPREPGAGGPTTPAGADDADGPDDLTCAICLGQIPPLDLALVKGCEHQYCVHCILQWAMVKEWCPQCKAPFTHLYTHRHLDGTPCDYPLEEGVTLLKRARWFTEELEARERAKALALSARRLGAADAALATDAAAGAGGGDDTDRYHGVEGGPPSPRDWCDLYEDLVDAELEEDEAIEQYYYSSAAGRARIVLGNRRWGGGGYMRNGRMYARPVQPGGGSAGASGSGTSGSAAASAAPPAVNAGPGVAGKGKGKAKGKSPPQAATGDSAADDSPGDKGKGKARAGGSPPLPAVTAGSCARPKLPKGAHHAWADVAAAVTPSPLGRSPCSYSSGGGTGGSWMAAAGALLGTSPGAACGGSAPGSGRRAKRNARRAAMDAASGGALDFD